MRHLRRSSWALVKMINIFYHFLKHLNQQNDQQITWQWLSLVAVIWKSFLCSIEYKFKMLLFLYMCTHSEFDSCNMEREKNHRNLGWILHHHSIQLLLDTRWNKSWLSKCAHREMHKRPPIIMPVKAPRVLICISITSSHLLPFRTIPHAALSHWKWLKTIPSVCW